MAGVGSRRSLVTRKVTKAAFVPTARDRTVTDTVARATVCLVENHLEAEEPGLDVFKRMTQRRRVIVMIIRRMIIRICQQNGT